MIEFRLLKSDEYKQAIALADRTFREAGHVSMGEAFPLVFSPALNQSYGVFDNGELVSFIGLVPSVVHVGPAEIQAYSIGAVCTHPEHRRKGYANTLLKKIFEHVRLAKASILFVSGILPMYLKAGCSFYGQLKKYEIQDGSLLKNENYFVREFLPIDWFHIRKLARSHFVHFEQSITDLSILTHAGGYASVHKMNHKILVAEKENEIKAFLVLGIPESSAVAATARIIEWGGNPHAIHAILAESFQDGIKTIKFSIPAYECELNHLLAPLKMGDSPFPGTAKIIDLDLLLEQLEPFLHGKIEIINVDKNYKRLQYANNSVVLDNASLEELLLLGNPNIDLCINDIFPIPLPFPEGLNYV